MADFGKTVKRLREELHMSQDDLARASGLSRGTIQNIEKRPSPGMQGSKYLRLAKSLNRTADQLDLEWRASKIEQSVGDPVGRGIPLINKAPAGNIVDYSECGATAN